MFDFNRCIGCRKKQNMCALIETNRYSYFDVCPCMECIVKSTCVDYCVDRSNLYTYTIDKQKKEHFNGKTKHL